MTSPTASSPVPHHRQDRLARPKYYPAASIQQTATSTPATNRRTIWHSFASPSHSHSSLAAAASPSSFPTSGLVAPPSSLRKPAPRSSLGGLLASSQPSAYESFDEIGWVVDLSSRIKSALLDDTTRNPSSPGSSYEPVPGSAKRRPRLSRPSRDFREIEQKVKRRRAQSNTGDCQPPPEDDPFTSNGAGPNGSEANGAYHKGKTMAIDASEKNWNEAWAKNAQREFEQRREAKVEAIEMAKAEKSQGKKRHGGSKSLSSSSSSASSSSSSTSSDEEEDEEEEEEEGSGAEQARTDVDPAVERSHLTAQSIRELLANGGVTTEGEENIDLGELLDSARPVLPGGQPPSSLFEAFKKDDGALDIGEILNHRARLSSEQAGAAASASAGPTNLKLTLPPADSGGKEQDGRKRPLIQEVNEIPEMDAEGESESEDSSEDELKSERAVKLKPLAHDETAAGSENGESRDSSDGVGSGDESQEEEGAEEDDVDNDDDLDEESDDNEEEEEEEEEEVMRPKRYSGNEGADASEPIVLSSSDEDEEDHDEVAEDSEDEEAESLQGAGMEDDDRDEDEDEEKEEDEEEEEGQGHGDSFEYDEDHEGDSLSRRAAAAAAAAKAGREFLDSYKAEDDEFNFEDEFEGEDVDDDGLDDESEEEEEEEDEGDHDHLRRHSHDGSSHLDLEETDDNRNVVEPVGQNRPSTVQAESTSVDRNKQFSSFTSASQLFYSQDGFQHRDSRENLAIDQRAPQPLKSEQASGKLFEGADFASIDPQLLGNILQNVQATQPSSSSSSSMQGIMDTARLAVPASEPSNLVPSAPAFFNESFDQSFSQLLEGDLADTVASAETREPVGQDIIKMVDENPVEIPSELPMLEVMGQEEIGSGRSIGSTASKGDEDESLAKQPPVETQALSGQLAPIFEQATQVQVEALSSGTDAAVEIPSQIKGPENLALFRMKTGQLDPPTPSVASVAGSLDGNATPVVPSTPGHSAETGHHINIESEALESSVDLVEGDAMPTLKGELSTEESSHPVPSIDALVELRKATGALDSPALSLKSEKGSAVAATMHSALPEAPLEEVREGKVDLEMVSPQQANTEDAPHPAPTVEALVALREQVGTLDSPASLSTRSISSGTEIISAKPLKGEEEARKEAGKQENDQDMKAGNESQSDAATRVVPASDEGPPSARDTVNPTRVSEEAIRIDIGEEVALVAGGEEDKEAQTVEGTGEGREARGEEDIEKEEAEDERAMRGVNAEVIFPKDADDAAEPKRESEMNAESVNAEPLDNRGTRNSTEVDAEDGDEDEERELEDEVRSIFRPKSPTPESSTLSHQEPTIAEIGNHAETSVEKQTVAEAGTQQEGVDHLKGRSLRSLKKEYKQVLAQIETKKEAVQSQSGKDDEETKARSRGDLRPRSMAQPSSSEGSGPLPVTPNQGVIPLPGRPSTLPMSAILRDRHRHQHGVKRTPYSSAVVSTPMSVYSTSSALTELSEEGEAESAIQALSPRVEIRASQTEMPLETTTSGDHKIEKPEEDDDRGEGGQGEEEEEGQPAGNRGPSTRSQCSFHRLCLSRFEDAPTFIVPQCSIMHDVLKEEGAKDCGEATEKENDVKIDFDPEDLPAEIHHCLSRIIGIQMLPDTSVVPGTSAERLLRRELSDDDEEIPQTKASEGGDATEGDGHAPLSDGAEVAIEEGSRSPTLPTKRPRRISNEGAGSHNSRRSPRKKLNRPDPESPEANFLPRSERKMVHPSHGKHQPFDGDLSFETLEGEEGMEEDVQDATTPGVGLGFTEEQVDEVMEDATEAPPATVVVKEGKAGTSSSKSKRRTSGRRSLGTDPSFKPDKEDVAAAFESEEEEQANKPSRRKATTGRKRAPSLLSVGVEVADSVTTPKRTRRSEPASSAAFKPPKTVEGEDDSDDQDPNPDPTLRETRARREEKEVIHQVLGDDQVENLHEQEEESKGKGKKKGGVATTSNKARSTRRQSSRSSARRN